MISEWLRSLAAITSGAVIWLGVPAASHAGLPSRLSAGFTVTCAIKVDGSLWCWGSNYDGQLGTGSFVGQSVRPVVLSTLGRNVVEVAVGDAKGCARDLHGALWCWGAYYVGDGTNTTQLAPVEIASLGATLPGIAVGEDHICAITTDHALWCWGRNNFGQLGDGTTAPRPSPVQVTALGTEVVEVAASFERTCARKQDGTLWCWGYNGVGQLGDGTDTDRHTPVQVTALGASVTQVSTGYYHTCARTTDGAVWCWGANDSGQLGSDTTDTLNPTQVSALGTSVTKLSSGSGGQIHSCAIETDHTLWCWGGNFEGELGNGTTVGSTTPIQVTALGATVVDVSTGGRDTCAAKADGSLWCWGAGDYAQIGDGSQNINRLSPVQVSGFGPLPATPAAGNGALAALACLLALTGWVSSRRSLRAVP
jgi:alpha-tubulin suppressor-like RCC1 family protein